MLRPRVSSGKIIPDEIAFSAWLRYIPKQYAINRFSRPAVFRGGWIEKSEVKE